MKSIAQALLVAMVPLKVQAEAPVAKVLSMLSNLQATIIQEGEVAQKEYAEFAEWCEDRASNLGFEVKTGNAGVESLKASIGQEFATLESLNTKVEDLAGSIAIDEADLKSATEIRSSEAADFAAEDSELTSIVDMLRRASGIIEREMQGGASMLQLKNAGSLIQALIVMVQASMISSTDVAKLTAFVQESQKDEDTDDDAAPGAPAATVYGSHSGDILSTLQDLSEKAETQLADLRKRETVNQNNFEMLKQSLEDELKFGNKDMSEAKRGIAVSSEKKSTAEGDLSVTSKDLNEDLKAKSSLHHDCMTKSTAFEAGTRSRGEELRALATAKKVIAEATGSFSQLSFVQVAKSGRLSSGLDLANLEAVRLVRDLAHKEGSSALMQLASQMASSMYSHDPFVKIKGLISDMISKLEDEAGADATKKAYCDKELSETNTKKTDKTAEISKLSTRMDQMSAKAAQLKDSVATLQSQLSKLFKAQAEMDRLRQEEKTAFNGNKAELEKGLTGIKLGLKILNDYYAQEGKAHTAAEGAGSGIIGLLEVVEADFSKNLAQVTSDEEMAVTEYEQVSKENQIEKTTKDQDVRYKTKEFKYLDKFSSELSADRTGVQAELDAVQEYLSKIEEECIARAETYGARKARFESEISGLKEALQILESETALVQRKTRRVLRGGRHINA